MISYPKITVITVCLNEVNSIEETINTVVTQSYQNTEYVVIDGGSTDGTLQKIEKYVSSIDIIEHQKGKGIYNAMNQGIALSNGDYLYFLNAGDRLYSKDTLSHIAGMISQDNGLDIVFGDYLKITDSGEELVTDSTEISMDRLKDGMICHQAMFSNRKMFERNGGFDESLSIVADYDWLARNIVKGKLRTKYVQRPIVKWDSSGVSSTSDYRIQQFLAMKRYFGIFYSLEKVFYPNVARKLRALWRL